MRFNDVNLKKIGILLTVVFAIFSIIEFGIGMHTLLDEKNQVDNFLDDEEIVKFSINVPTQDGAHISAIIYMDKDMSLVEDYSVPTIIYVPGANNHKSNLFDKKYQAIKFGFAVIAMEQRGHGESGGYFSLYGHEFTDISDVITYVGNNFKQLNYTHMGLIGMSLGGGAAVGAQAIDDRIFASSIYHPAANLTDFFNTLNLDLKKYLGFFPSMEYPYPISLGIPDWDKIIDDAWFNRSAVNLVTPENTMNMLILHGTEDDMITPEASQGIIDKADPLDNRVDVQLVMRDGLGHGENERNDESFKYTISWFRHFFKNDTIDISNLEQETQYIELFDYNFPEIGVYKDYFLYFSILLGCTLFTGFFVYDNPVLPTIHQIQVWQSSRKSSNSDKLSENKNGNNDQSFSIFLGRSFIVLVAFALSGLYSFLRNPSVILSLFLYPLLIAIPLYLLIPDSIFMNKTAGKQSFREEIRLRYRSWLNKSKLKEYILGSLPFIIPPIVYLNLMNLGGNFTIDDIAAPEFSVALGDLMLFTSLLALPFFIMRDIPAKYSVLLIPVLWCSAMITIIFVPIYPLSYLPFEYQGLFIALVIGLLYFFIYFIGTILKYTVFRNNMATLTIIGVLVSIFLWIRFTRVI